MDHIKTAATLTGIASKVDGSLSLRFGTQELSPQAKLALFEMQNTFGWLLFCYENTSVELPKEPVEDKSKTPSKRLRAVLYKLFAQTGQAGDFEVWYRNEMERIIDHFKSKLDL